MRLWSLHPKYLDTAGLNACWREGLLAKNVLLGKTKGYRQHPQLLRFQLTPSPVKYIDAYLTVIYNEATRRGFVYDASKIDACEITMQIPVCTGQLVYEWEHLKRKLLGRAPKWFMSLPEDEEIMQNPVFMVKEGGIELWERENLT